MCLEQDLSRFLQETEGLLAFWAFKALNCGAYKVVKGKEGFKS